MSLNRWLYYGILGGLGLLMFTPLVISYSMLFPFITGKAFFFRIIVGLIFGVWLLLAAREPEYRPRGTPLFWAVTIFTLILVLATAFSLNPARSFWSNFERMEGLVSYLHLFAFFLVISSVLRSEHWWRRLLGCSLTASVLVSVYGLAQIFGWAEIHQGGVRVDASLGNATYLAVYLLIHLFIAAWFWLERPPRPRWPAWLYGGVIILELIVLYHTATRGAILGLLAGSLVVAGVVAYRGVGRIRRLAFSLIIVLAVIVAGFVAVRNMAWVQANPILSRFANISWSETTTQSRLLIWQMSYLGFKDRPLLGWGPENYNLVFNQYYRPELYRQEPWFDRSHNVFFDWLINAGLLGLLSYLSIFILAALALWRRLKQPSDPVTNSLWLGLLVAYFVHNFFVFDNLVSYILFLTIIAYINYRAWPTALPFGQSWPALGLVGSRVTAGLLAVALATGLYYLDWQPLAKAKLIIIALSPPGTRDLTPDQVTERRLAAFQRAATGSYLGRAEAREQFLQYAFQIFADPAVSPTVKEQFLTAALAAMEQQTAETPLDARGYFFLGNSLSALGASEQALPFLEQAAALSPQKVAILLELGLTYVRAGQADRGLQLLAETVDRVPSYNEARMIYALALMEAGRTTTGRQILFDAYGTDIINHDRLLNTYFTLGWYDKVLDIWRLKTEAEPDNFNYRLSLAAAYLNVGRRAEAIETLEKAVVLQPQFRSQADYLIGEIRAGRNPQ